MLPLIATVNLTQLFEVIDVDESGWVSWEEFLDFCVEAGDWQTKAVGPPRSRLSLTKRFLASV